MEKKTFGRIIYVDPNDLASFRGYTDNTTVKDNVYWNPEDLNISVDLEVIVPNRYDAGSVDYEGQLFEVSLTSNSKEENKWASFLSGTYLNDKSDVPFLTDNYTNMSYSEIKNGKKSDNECLGIESVDITFDSSFYPQVTIKFIDVHGYSLINPSEEEISKEGVERGYVNFFRALMHFPYPRFMLSVKGEYGSRVTFMLAVHEFNTNFNSTTGNFEVTVTFIGYMYGIYNDIPFNFLLVAPYLDCKNNISKTVTDKEGDSKTKYSYGPYWKNKVNDGTFLTKEGQPLKTFVEFMNDYYDLEQKLTDVKGEVMKNGGAISKNSNLKDKRDALNSMRDAFVGMLKSVVAQDKLYTIENKGVTVYNGDYTKIKGKIVIFKDVSTISKTLWGNKYQEYKKALYAYTGKEAYEGEFVLNDSANVWEKETVSLKKCNNIENCKGKTHMFSYDTANIFGKIAKEIEDINAEISKNDDDAIKEEKEVLTKVLGYSPNIENIFRMIFAHLDTFMHFFYDDVVNVIGKENRPISKFKGFTVSDSDLGQKNKPMYLPPFPYVFKVDENKRRTLVYPEEYGNGTVFTSNSGNEGYMAELDFVNRILEAAIQLHEELDVKINNEKNEESGESKANLKFIPLAITDIYYYLEGKTPYDSLDYLDGDGNKLISTLLYLIQRGITSCMFTGRHIYVSNSATNYASPTSVPNVYSDSKLETKFFNELGDGLANIESSNYKTKFRIDSKLINDLKARTTEQNFNELYKSIVNSYNESYGLYNYAIFNKEKNNIFTYKKDILFNKIPSFFTGYTFNDIEKGLFYIGNDYVIDDKTNFNTDGFFKIWDDYENRKTIEDIINLPNKITDLLEKQKVEINEKEKDVLLNTFKPREIDNEKLYEIDSDEVCILKKNCDGVNPYALETFKECSEDAEVTDYNGVVGSAIEENIQNDSVDGFNLSSLGYYSSDDFEKDNAITMYFKYYHNREEWKKIFTDKKKEFLFLLYCLPYNLSSKVYQSISNGVLYGESEYFLKLPLGMLLYIGGIIYATEEYIKNGGKHILYPIFDFSDEAKKEINRSKGTNEHVIPIYNLKEKYEKAVWSNETIILKEYRTVQKKHKKVLVDLFLKYAKKYASIKITATNYEGMPFIPKNSALDTFVKKIFLQRSMVMTTNVDKNINLDAKKFVKNFLTKLVNTDTEDNEKKEKAVTSIEELDKNHKLATYKSLKIMYDKWLAGYKYEQFRLPSPEEHSECSCKRYVYGEAEGGESYRSEFNNFLFVDSFYNDISSDFYVDIKAIHTMLYDQIKSQSNASMFEFMTSLAEKNKLLFLSLPIYNNYYDADSLANIFIPLSIYNPNSHNIQNRGNTYLLMYTHEISHNLENTSDSEYENDGLDLTDTSPTNIFNAGTAVESNSMEIKVPSFAVTFGRQNQGYFKNIKVNMENPRVTDYSVANTFQLANVAQEGDTYEPAVVGQNIYSIYSNRSYNCSVDMMGCANIMPMMYFQLNNIPMFRGAYMITNVQHHIQAGTMHTSFSGVRMSKNLIPFNNHLFDIRIYGNEVKEETEESYVGNNNTSEGGSGNCEGYNVDAAFAKMNTEISNGSGTRTTIPLQTSYDDWKKKYGKNDNGHFCARAVRLFVSAALGKEVEARGNDGYRLPRFLAEKYDFIRIDNGVLNGKSKSEIIKWTEENCKPGDVVGMSKGDKLSEPGHTAMYYGGGVFVSDVNHKAYVYSNNPTIYEVYRYKTCNSNDTSGDDEEGKNENICDSK